MARCGGDASSRSTTRRSAGRDGPGNAQSTVDPLQAEDPWHRWNQNAGDPGALFADLPEREVRAFNGGVASFQGFAATPADGAQESSSSTMPVGGAVYHQAVGGAVHGGDPMGGWHGAGRGQPPVGPPPGVWNGSFGGRPPRPVFSYGGNGNFGNFGNGYGMMNNGSMGPGSFYGFPHQVCGGGLGGLHHQVQQGPGIYGHHPCGQAQVPGYGFPFGGLPQQGFPCGPAPQTQPYQHVPDPAPTQQASGPAPTTAESTANGATQPQAQSGTGPQVSSAAAFDSMLGGGASPKSTAGMTSAFEALGRTKPPEETVAEPSQQETMRQLINALSGEKKSMPTWGGSPTTLRSWLRSLAFWEQDNSTPKHRWGLKLYHALSGDAKQIAEQVTSEEILSERGYGAILTCLLQKFRPYLEVTGPMSVDIFLYSGERTKGEAFANYVARKEVQKQEMEAQIGEKLSPLVAGRILLKQANISDMQRDLMNLKTHQLMTFDAVADALRPLDRMDVLSKATNMSMKASYATASYEDAEHYVDENGDIYYAEEWDDEELWWEEESSPPPSDDVVYFEDKEYDEVEAIYVQAYNDVRRDLKSRRKERGFIKHQAGGKGGKSKGKGKGKRSGKGKSKSSRRPSPSTGMLRGSDAELESRTRCWNCQELGHYERNCPLKQAGSKTKFVVVKGSVGDTPSSAPKTTATPKNFPVFQRRFASGFPQFRSFVPEVTATTLSRVSTHGAGARTIYAGVRCSGYEALVDTAAEDAVMGTHAYTAMCDELALHNLQPVLVNNQQRIPCTGIGGAARIRGIVDIPTSVAGLLGVIRFTIIEDEGAFATPPLLPISYLEAVGSVLNLRTNTYETADGHTTTMRRLPSGHRAINMLDFATTSWKLPPEHRVRGRDPFKLLPGQLPPALQPLQPRGSSHSFLGGVGAGRGTGRVGFGSFGSGARSSHGGGPGQEGEEDRDFSRSRSRSYTPTVTYASEPATSPELRSIHEEGEEGRDGGGESEQEVITLSPSATGSVERDIEQSYADNNNRGESETFEEEREEEEGHDWDYEVEVPEVPPPELPIHEPRPTAGDGIYWRGPFEDPSTDGSSTPERAYPTHVRLTRLNGQQLVVSNGVEIHYFVKKVDGQTRHLEMQMGWRNALPTPRDLRRSPVETLDTRRSIDADFFESRPRSFHDHWTANVRFQEAWCGKVTFYEAVPTDGPPDTRYAGPGIWGNYGDGPNQGGGGGGSSSSGGSQFHLQLPPRGRGGWTIPPRSTPDSSGRGGKGKGASASKPLSTVVEEGILEEDRFESVCSSEAVRCEFFNFDEMESNQDIFVVNEPENVKTMDLRSWHAGFGCPRRVRVHDRSRSKQSQMLSALSRAASSFLTRWSSRHVEGEQELGGGELLAVQDLPDGRDGAEGEPRSTAEDGFSKDFEGMASCGHRHADADRHDQEADGAGLPAEEGCRGGRRRAGEDDSGQDQQHQEGQGRVDRPGDRSASGPVKGPEVLAVGSGVLQPSSGVHEMQGKPVQPMVDLPELRRKMGTDERRSVGFILSSGGAGDSNGSTSEDSTRILPVLSPCTTIQTGTRECEVGSHPERKSSGIDDWKNWLNTGASTGVNPWQIFLQGKDSIGSAVAEQTKETVPQHGLGDSGVRGRQSRLGQGHGGRRLLLSKDQLGGTFGKKLCGLVGCKFSTFMVFLCMNCWLSTSTTKAFGEPLLSAVMTASGEFSEVPFSFAAPPEDEKYTACFVYPKLEFHIRQGEPDLHGRTFTLSRPTRRTLEQAIKKNKVVMEIYSPPRVTEKARDYGFESGGALDLSTGWDLSRKDHQHRALQVIQKTRPALVILSPPCTAFSRLRGLSNHKRDPEVVAREVEEALEHVNFSVRVAWIQHRAVRGFLFEHPMHAESWNTPKLAELRQADGVMDVKLDMCRFGLTTTKGFPALKPTLLITNLESLATTLQRRCDGFHERHHPLIGGEAKFAAKYTPKFVDAILRGLRKQVQTWIRGNRPQHDYWETKQTSVVRIHRHPRRTLFTPTGMSSCPLPIPNLGSKRTTTMQFQKGNTMVKKDDWRATPTPHLAFSALWTGQTEFANSDTILLPQPWHGAAAFIVAAAAHPIYDYLSQESAFQTEWTSSFPSRKILRGAGPDENEEADEAMDFDDDLEAALDLADPESQPQQRPQQREEDEEKVAHGLRELRLPRRQLPDGLHPELQREVFRIHRNLGHPTNEMFLRALKHAGVKKEILNWVKTKFHCDLCQRKQKANPHRPGKLQKIMEFNEVVGVDTFTVNDKPMLNILDWGSDLQIVEPLVDKRAETVCAKFMQSWVAHYGAPKLLVCDQGREFTGAAFVDYLNQYGVPIHFIDVRAPWQNSRTEKAGDIYKNRLETVIHETTAVSEEDFLCAVAETSAAHNRYYNRSGFSPYQRAFGTMPRLPGSLLSDDALDRELVCASAGEPVKRAWEIREAAARAWHKQQDGEAVKRALGTRTRTADLKEFKQGDLVYVWRNIPGYKGWTGPGTVIADSNNSLWISLRGYLVKASREQVRVATSEESIGAELVAQLSAEMLEALEKGTLRNYRDLAEEGAPEEEDRGYSPSTQPAESPMEDVDETMLPAQAQEGDDQGQALPGQDLPVQDPPGREPDDGASTRTPMTDEEFNEFTRALSRRSSLRVDEASSGAIPFGPPIYGDGGTGPSRRGSVASSSARQAAMPYPSPPVPAPSLPPPPTNFYIEVSKDVENGEVKWKKDKVSGNYFIESKGSAKFQAKNAWAMFNEKDGRCYLTKAKTSPGQVTFKRLSDKHRDIFRAARAKEVKSLLDSGAIQILSIEESKKFVAEHPKHVLESRYVDRWKPTDAFGVVPEQFGQPGFVPEDHGGLAPKSRWCVVGWQDPMIHEIERASPTPQTASIYLMLAMTAARKWSAVSKDAKTAFLQSRNTTRTQKLACRMPADEAFQGYHPDQLILLLTEVYGLVSGPAWWRRSLLEILVKDLGYRVNVYDRCVLTLDASEDTKNAKTEGIMVLEVDDILEAGNERHREKMALLEKKLRFGKVVKLQEADAGSGYAGRRLQQLPDFSFEFTMNDYVKNRLQKVNITRKFLKKDSKTITLGDDEESQLRGTIASINWAAREGRPDGSAAASILSGCFPNPNMEDVLVTNTVVDLLKAKDITMRIHAIPEEKLRHILIADSSFDPSGKVKPQHGWIQGLTTPDLNLGKTSPVSMIAWRSKRLRRKAGSTTLCESISLSTALAAMEKQYAMLLSMRFSRFDPRSLVEDEEISMGLRGSPTVIASENPRYIDPDTVAIIDAKSVYDSTANTEQQFQGEDDRAALEAAIIHESLAKLKARLRWVPHNYNPADSLTKLPHLAHMKPLYDLLEKGYMQITEEATELASGRQGDHRMKVHG